MTQLPDFRVLVTGGRDYGDAPTVNRTLDQILAGLETGRGMILIVGGARGADKLAQNWAELHDKEVELIVEKADWLKYGRAAGPIRNQLMLDKHKPELVVAFPGGKGTSHMVQIAQQAGVQVLWAAPQPKYRTAPHARQRAS